MVRCKGDVDRLLFIGALFVLAGLCEIGGGYLVWGWMRASRFSGRSRGSVSNRPVPSRSPYRIGSGRGAVRHYGDLTLLYRLATGPLTFTLRLPIEEVL